MPVSQTFLPLRASKRDQPHVRGGEIHLVLIKRQAADGAGPFERSGPMRFSQISSPVRASSAWTMLSGLPET